MNKKIFNSEIILNNFSKILEKQNFNDLELITNFENKIKKYNNDEKNYYIAFNNNTNVYNTIISLLINKNKNKIIVPAICPRDFLFSLLNFNVEPIFCEINNYGNIDENYLEDLLLNKININEIAAIYVFHNNGIPVNIEKINKIADTYNIIIIEDSSEAFGSEYNNQKIGTGKNITIFNFDENNILYAGGISLLVTSNFNLAEKLYSYRNCGKTINKNNIIGSIYLENNNYSIIGANYLPNIFNIIIGLNNLNFIDAEINIKKDLYDFYLSEIKKMNLLNYYLITNEIPEYCTRYNYNSFRLVLGKLHSRDLLAKFLEQNKIDYYIKDIAYYKLPILNFKNIFFKKAEIFDKQSIIIPINSNITNSFQKEVITKIKEYFIYEKNI